MTDISVFEFANTHQPSYFNSETDIHLRDEETETWNRLSTTPYSLSSLVTALKTREVEVSNVRFAEPIAREYLHHLMETGIAEEFHQESLMNRERLVAFADAGYTAGEDLIGTKDQFDISQETGIDRDIIAKIATNYLGGFSSGEAVANTGPLDHLDPTDSFEGWDLVKASPNRIRWVSAGRFNLTISPAPDGGITVVCNTSDAERHPSYRKGHLVESGSEQSLTPQEALDQAHEWLESHELEYEEDLAQLPQIGPSTKDYVALEYGITTREGLREFRDKHPDEFDDIFGSLGEDLREALDSDEKNKDEERGQ